MYNLIDIEDRQHQVYIKFKGKKHIRLAIGNDVYCCVHFLRKKENMLLLEICRGTIVVGSRFTFARNICAMLTQTSAQILNFHTLKWKAEET